MFKTPLLFIGHGSPMNAVESNTYTESWRKIGETIEKPRAILIFSTHWITEGQTRISSNEHPEMIYDMYGFPPELYRVRYNASGSREIAEEIASVIARNHPVPVDDDVAIQVSENTEHGLLHSSQGQKQQKLGNTGFLPTQEGQDQSEHGLLRASQGQKPPKISLDSERGFDHGVWSTLIHIFPNADVPIISMSLDYLTSPRGLYALGASLAILRDSGILIMGSGNIVHNLGAIDWSGKHTYPWAVEFDKKVANLIESRDFVELLDFKNWGEISRLAHPSYDHLLPLFPLLGASSLQDRVSFFTPDIVMGSLSMRSVKWD